MSTTFTIKRGDTVPSMVATISSTVDSVTTVVDLTLATEVLAFFDSSGVILERACVVDANPLLGKVSYTFVDADWATGQFAVGSYKLEFQVTFSDGSILSVPTSGYLKLTVKPDLSS